MRSAVPVFSGSFGHDFEEFVDAFKAHFSASTGVPWGQRVDDGSLLSSALALALRDDTLGTVLSASNERDPRLLAIGESWQAGGFAMWQALRAIYGQGSAPVLQQYTESQYHVACDSSSFTLCPHCKVRARRLLDAAQQRRWGLVFAECDEHLVNYLPEDGERPDDSSPERSFFSLAHWAAFHGDADAVRALAGIPSFRPTIETRRGRVAAQVASDVARARQSLRHARVASLLESLEVSLERNQAAFAKRSYETESRAAFATGRASAANAAAFRPAAPLQDLAARRNAARPDFRKEAPYRWPDSALGGWPEGFRR